MVKSFNEVTTQVAVIRTSKKTLAFYANVEPVPKERFMELIDGKVKISLRDFSRGKGDNAIHVSYNLDLPNVRYLYERAKHFNLPTPYAKSKIVAKAIQTEGAFRGLCPTYRLYITRTPVNSKGEKMRSPWVINIKNGYAKALPGQNGNHFEASSTFKQTGEVQINLSDEDFLDCMDKIHSYLEIYKSMIGYRLIPQGLKLIKERDAKGYSSNMNIQNAQQQVVGGEQYAPPPQHDYNQPVQSAVPYYGYAFSFQEQSVSQYNQLPNQVATQQQMAQQQTNQAKTTEPDVHATTILVNSEFQALENNVCAAQCVAKGREFVIFFPYIPEEIVKSQQGKYPIKVNLYQQNGKFIFHSLAA